MYISVAYRVHRCLIRTKAHGGQAAYVPQVLGALISEASGMLDEYGVTNGTLAGNVPYVAVIAPNDNHALAFTRTFAQVTGLAQPWCQGEPLRP